MTTAPVYVGRTRKTHASPPTRPRSAFVAGAWGAGYRYRRDDLENLGPAFAFLPPAQTLHRGHIFAQDEIALANTLDLTLGLKFEHNNYTGWEYLPNARLAWRLAPDHLLWTSASRAVRAPSRVDRELFASTPTLELAGGPDFESEVANVLEVGYRAQPMPALHYSISAFHHDFDRLRTIEPTGAGQSTIRNRMEGTLTGVNAWASYRVTPAWRLTGGAVKMRQKLALEPGSASLGGIAAAGNDPTHWWQLGSSLDITPRHQFDLRVRHIGGLPNPPVPKYTAFDARFGWKVTREAELSLTVQNIFDPGHPEWGVPESRTEVERSIFLKLVWRM